MVGGTFQQSTQRKEEIFTDKANQYKDRESWRRQQEHFVKSEYRCCTHGTNIILYFKYTSIKKPKYREI